jgi:HPt (histidine-containing phosphotransfer) domain-containing protein
LAEIREKCLRSGMDDFLVKPFDELQIGEMLRHWIPSRERAPREKTCSPEETCIAAKDDAAHNAAGEANAVIDLGAINKIRAIQGEGSTSLFERVVSQFADTAPALTAAIRVQSDAGDTEAVWRTAHSLKSSAAALGAGRLSRRCAQIESLARESGAKPASDLLDALEADLAAPQTGLRELIGADHG